MAQFNKIEAVKPNYRRRVACSEKEDDACTILPSI